MASYVPEGSSVESSEEEVWAEDAESSKSQETSSAVESDVPTTSRKARKQSRVPAAWIKNMRKCCWNSGKKYISDSTKAVVCLGLYCIGTACK